MDTKTILVIIVPIVILFALIGGISYISLNGNVVVSDSMTPALHKGDVVIVDKNPDNIQVRDILIYKATWFPQPVIHRVIAIKKDSKGNELYEMKGDNLPVSDPELVSKDQIISKVEYTIPQIGYMSLKIRGL